MARSKAEVAARTNALLRDAKLAMKRNPEKKRKATFALYNDQVARVQFLGIVLGLTQSEVIGRMIDSEAIENEVRESVEGEKKCE